MFGLKLFVVASVVAGAVVAATPGDSVCYTAPAVTTTVTVTECGQPTTPAASTSKSEAHSTAPPPIETSWLPSTPAPAPSSPAPPAPAPPASSGPTPGPSTSILPAPPASSGGPSGSETSPEPTPTASDNPNPSSSSEPEQPPSNAASLLGVSRGVGCMVAIGVTINAAIAMLF